MANDISPTDLRGFILSWPFTTDHIWTAQSNYSQENPYPDIPEPQQSSYLGLTSTGTFGAQEPIDIQTIKAGSIEDCGFAWKLESDTDYYGSDGAGAISRWDVLQPGQAASTVRYNILQAISTPEGEQLILVEYQNITILQTQSIRVYKRAVNGTITSTTIYSQPYKAIRSKGSITRLSDGNYLAIFSKIDGNNKMNLEVHSSPDGSSWTLHSIRAIPQDIDGSGTFGAGAAGVRIERIRIAESLGQILLLVNVLSYNTSLSQQNGVYQYSSTDLGCNFIHVANTDGTNPYFSLDIVIRDGQFQVFYIDNIDESQFIFLENSTTPLDRALGFGATTPVINGEFSICELNPTYGYLEDGYQAVWIDNVGKYHAVYKDVGSGSDTRLIMFISQDGETWTAWGNPEEQATPTLSKAKLYDIGDASVIPNEISGCSGQGKNFLFYNYDFIGSHNYGGIHILELGGYSTINLPGNKEFPQYQERVNWSYTWVPINSPDNTAHYTALGTGTIIQGTTKATFETTPSQYKYVESPAFTTTDQEGVIIRSRLKPIQEGRLDTGRGIQIHTPSRKATVYIDTSGLALYDEHAGSTLGSVTVTTTNEIEILFVVTNNKARAWYRIPAIGEKTWIPLANGSLTSGTSATYTHVRWGHLDLLSTPPTQTIDLETDWMEFHYAFGSSTGLQLENEPQNPEDLNPQYYPPQGLTAYITGGIQISTYDSPGLYGERYKIKETALSPIRYIFPGNSRSPRQPWRSSDVASQVISLFVDKELQDNENSTIGTSALGIHLNNINFREIQLHWYNAATASWVSIGTFSNDFNGQFNFARIGNTIQSTETNGKFLHYDEARDWILLMTGERTVARRVRTNTEGTFDAGTNRKRASLILENADPADPTSGTAYLIPTSFTIIWNQTAGLAALRITIPSQQTPENVFMIGSMLAGQVVIPQQYSRGRSITFESGTTATITNDGQEYTRTNYEGARLYRIAWAEGVDTSDLYETNPDPDYYTLSPGSVAIGAPNSTPTTMLGIARYCNGQANPLVYIPKIERTGSQLINTREGQILTTLQGDIALEHVLGNEFTGNLEGELFRVGTMVLKELI